MSLPAAELEVSAGEEQTARIERLYAAHRDQVFRLALRYGAGDAAFAEDVTHDVFVKLIRAWSRLDGDTDLGGWFYRVTTNCCLSRLTGQRLRQKMLSVLGIEDRERTLPDAVVDARSHLARVLEVMRTLPPKERVAFSMLHLDGRSQTEIAEIMGHSKGYVSKLVQRASERIRQAGYEVQND